MQLNSKAIKNKHILPQHLSRNTIGICMAEQQSQQSALLFQDFSVPHSTDKTHVGAEPTDLDTRWAL